MNSSNVNASDGLGAAVDEITAGGDDWAARYSDEFVQRHWPLLIFMLLEFVLVAGLYMYHIAWVKVQKKRAKNSAVLRLTEEWSLELLRHFLPSAKVEKYRFRGMTKKKAVASISFEDVTLELPSGEKILDGVSGEFKAGKMCAIMGPSGAGKTSLMNVLCGKASYGNATGSVRFNGVEGDYEEYKTVMGFVPQEDIVHEGLTVGEQIRFSADLRNPVETSRQRRKLITEDVLNVMQLGHIQNSIVGGLEKRGISGGQRKRVSIGLELAADPMMLFLDEPTSGLDAASSLSIVHSLKKMGQLGTTSVMVVHQPRYSLFCLFDDVLLLGKGGRTVYRGSATGAKPYFERLGFVASHADSPADWIMDVIAGEVPNHKIAHFVPEMLYELWEANSHSVQRSQTRERDLGGMEVDDWQAMVQKLDEEWPLICYMNAPSAMDPARQGVLREVDLLRLLKSKRNAEEDEEELIDMKQAARQLLSRIAGPSALVSTKREVRDFLAGLQGVVAEDKDVTKFRQEDRVAKHSSLRSNMSSTRSTRSTASSMLPTPRGMREDVSARTVPAVKTNGAGKLPILEEESKPSGRGSQKVLHTEAAHGAPLRECTACTCEMTGGEVVQQYSEGYDNYMRIEDGVEDRDSLCNPLSPAHYSPRQAPDVFEDDRSFALAGQVQPSDGDLGCISDAFSDEDPAPVAKELELGDMPREDTTASQQVLEVPRPMSSIPPVASMESLCLSVASSRARSAGSQRPKEFPVLIELVENSELGLGLSAAEDGTLMVTSVAEGRVQEWNIANPGLQIKKYDHIIQANATRGDPEAMLEECKKENPLELLVRPRDHKKRATTRHSTRGTVLTSAASSMPTLTNVSLPTEGAQSPTLLGQSSPSVKDSEIAWNLEAVVPATGPERLEEAAEGEKLEVVVEVSHLETLESQATEATGEVSAFKRSSKSFASAAGLLQRIASDVKTPGFCRQLVLLVHRSSIQWFRQSWHRAIFLGVISGSSVVLAVLDTFVVKEAQWQVDPFLNLHTTLALLSSVFCLHVFSTDRPVFWRERESGLSVAAFYVSKVFANTFDLLLQCFLLAAVYYMIRQPQVSFDVYFPPFLLVSFASAGLGYAISTIFPPRHGPFITAITIFVGCGLLGHPLRVETMSDGGLLETIMDVLSVTRWSVSLYFNSYLETVDTTQFEGTQAMEAIHRIEEIYATPKLVSQILLGMRAEIFFLTAIGIFWHIVGFLRLAYSNRNRHRRAAVWKQRMYRVRSAMGRAGTRVWGEQRQEELEEGVRRFKQILA